MSAFTCLARRCGLVGSRVSRATDIGVVSSSTAGRTSFWLSHKCTNNSSLVPRALQQVRCATKAAGGSVGNSGGRPGKRLGIKKFGGERVKPGNIIARQRGTKWRAGENVGIGRDHTLYALESGFVTFENTVMLFPRIRKTKKVKIVHVLSEERFRAEKMEKYVLKPLRKQIGTHRSRVRQNQRWNKQFKNWQQQQKQ